MRYLQKQNITMATKEGKSLLWALASAHSCQVIARQTQSGSLHTQHIMLLAAAKALRCATSSSQSAHTSPRGSGSNDWKRTVSLIPAWQGKGWGCFWLCCIRTSDAHLQAQISWGKGLRNSSCSLLLPHSACLVLTALSQDTACPPEHAGTAQPPPGTHSRTQG